MEHIKRFMNKSTLALTGTMLASLMLAALGGVFDAFYLAYFWYLGLAAIGLLMMISLLGGVIIFSNGCCKWCSRQKRIRNRSAIMH